ncbi:alpha/beta hydrolase [Microbacterium sp. 1P10UB]|uniref:alpha/beta fold hydrolase n=1 Tax=unclassified Microbacterium TaxID=2609290 RepID=UPI0039A18253
MPDDRSPIRIDVDLVRCDDAVTRVTHVAMTEPGPSRPFVLVAGLGVASTYFEFLAPTLAHRGDVYSLDLPGFGGLPKPSAQPDTAFFADQVEAVLDRFDLANPVLLGHSMGTQVVVEVLRRRPHISHAILVGPVVDDREPGALIQAVRFAQSSLHESLHLAMTALAAYLLCGTGYFLRTLPAMLRFRMLEQIAPVTAKVLLIRGEFDRSSPRRFHSRIVAAAQDAWRWEIEGAAHSVINGHAIGVARLAVRHLDGQLPRKGRMPEAQAALPPARHADVRMVLAAVGARVREWFSALRQDPRGVEASKRLHARILWEAYDPDR